MVRRLVPPLRRALAEVRRVQAAPLAAKRALIAAPRAFLRRVLEVDIDDTVIEEVFRETTAYADRVVGLGLWAARVLPWIKLPPSNWFGPENAGDTETREPTAEPVSVGGIIVGDRSIPLTPQEAQSLQARVEDAIGAGRTTVPLQHQGSTVEVPATYETLAALQALETSRKSGQQEKATGATSTPEVLVIRPNEEQVDVEGAFSPRASPPFAQPVVSILRSSNIKWRGLFGCRRPGLQGVQAGYSPMIWGSAKHCKVSPFSRG